jgi:drug/metabolite transporter (DMT)-like permease
MKQHQKSAWWLVVLSITSSVAAQTIIKLGVSHSGAANETSNLLSLIVLILQSPILLLGLALFGIGALAWIAVLSRFHLSVVYPFLALNMFLVPLISTFLLGETVPVGGWGGIFIICVGILIVSRSSR